MGYLFKRCWFAPLPFYHIHHLSATLSTSPETATLLSTIYGLCHDFFIRFFLRRETFFRHRQFIPSSLKQQPGRLTPLITCNAFNSMLLFYIDYCVFMPDCTRNRPSVTSTFFVELGDVAVKWKVPSSHSLSNFVISTSPVFPDKRAGSFSR